MAKPEFAPDGTFEIVSEDGLRATINPEGAYVESLQPLHGSHLLFPKTEIDNGKSRGGVFACAPIFGPGERVGLAQHGFARDLEWRVVPSDDQNLACLSYSVPSDEASPELKPFAGCNMDLVIRIDTPEPKEAWLQMSLKIRNDGPKPLVVAPGFHPYFPIEAGKSAEDIVFRVQQKDGSSLPMQFNADELRAAQVLESPENKGLLGRFQNGNYEIEVGAKNLSHPVVWSDNAASYVCFEPTAAGPMAAASSDISLEPYKISLGEEREYFMDIHWTRREDLELTSPAQDMAAIAMQ
jgi:galactose mutarotase-like enzyme